MRYPERRLPPAALFCLLLISMLLAACGGSATPTEPVETTYLTGSPALLDTISPFLQDYNREFGVQAWQLDILSPAAARSSLTAGDHALIMSILPPEEDWFTTPILDDGLVFIVHPDNAVRDIPASSLAGLLSGRTRMWEMLNDNPNGNSLAVEAVVLQRDTELRILADDLLMNSVQVSPQAIAAPTPAEVKNYVANHPGAIGYVPLSQVDEEGDRVRICRIDGVRPGETTIADGTYPLQYQILAMSLTEPQGLLRDWLTWMQSR